MRGGDHPGEVLHVEDPGHAGVEGRHHLALVGHAQDRTTAEVSARDLEDPLRLAAWAPVGRDPAARRLGDLHGAGGRGADHQITVGWDERQELAEGVLDSGLVGEDVGVVELDRGQDHEARAIVQELRLLVEEGRVVLVPFDDEIRAGAETPGA